MKARKLEKSVALGEVKGFRKFFQKDFFIN